MSNANENPILVNIISLGCAKNLVDSEVICGSLASNGLCLVQDMEDADAVVINTCGFIRDARLEAERAIKKALKWKAEGAKQGYLRMVLVGGCLPQKEPEECLKKFSDADVFFGLDALEQVWKMIVKFFNGNKIKQDSIDRRLPKYLYNETTPRLPGTPLPYANVKIAEGCNHKCAFCAIPGIRGNLRSRSPESIIEECRQLLAMGFTELDFIAQDSTAYGMDRKDGISLAELLKRCDKELYGDFWIRVLYTHPAHITDEFLDVLDHGTKHVLPYLDMPLQHISDHILKDMRRRFSEDDTRALIRKIRTQHPNIVLRTTFLVGFPGETEEDFDKLMDFLKETRFERVGAFAFSPEKGTPAGEMTEGLVSPATANKRKSKLLAAQRNISLEINQSLVGTTQTVIVDKRISANEYLCRLIADAPEVDQNVTVKMPAKYKTKMQEGDFASVVITSAEPYALKGKIQ